MANRRAAQISPYLLQHQHNPVDWYPWGREAFEAARREDKPLLISVGYSSCHWCHVMARESFEDPETAALMNERFINVKVDREERPDVDAIYMNAVQAMTGTGGWPMTVVATPAGEPFFGGTYFPPEDRYGQPAFRKVLESLSLAWLERRDEVVEAASQMSSYLGRISAAGSGGPEQLPEDLPKRALRSLQGQFDGQEGGFGGAPKFPPHSLLQFLLARPEEEARQMAFITLRRMAKGGIFDQLAGGFARYSVDASWTVPHFQKMLFDNGQLLSAYSAAYSYSGEPLFEEVILRTVDWLRREMRSPGGAFYSSLDAESEGEEGRYYVWDAGQFDRAVEGDRAAHSWYGVSDAGNYEGRNVLTAVDDEHAFALEFDLDPRELGETVERWRDRLLRERETRVRPARDEKILVSWNALAISGLANAGRVLARPEITELAAGAARFLRENVWQDGRLFHVYTAGERSVPGLLEDYALLGQALLDLYEATVEEEWLYWALELAQVVTGEFGDPGGPFFSTPPESVAELLVRPKELTDSSMPAQNAAAAHLLTRCARLRGDPELERIARDAVSGVAQLALERLTAMGETLRAIEFLLHAPQEVAVVGPRTDSATEALLRIAQRHPLPYAVFAHSEGPESEMAARLPFLEGRTTIQGKPAAYVCERMVCQLPVTTQEEFARQLAGEAATVPQEGGAAIE